MRKKRMLLVVLLTVTAVVAAGCRAEQVLEPQVNPVEPEEALDVALSWLQDMYPDEAPAGDIAWFAQDVQVLGPDGQPLVGAVQRRFSSADWVADVSWALVGPEFLVYDITLRSPSFGWYWNGTVRAMGGEVTEETAMQMMTVDLATELARQFVTGSRTYMSSGISQTLGLVETSAGDCSFCWILVFQFESENSGYGDAVGQVVIQGVTPHRAVIIVEGQEVVEAIMDDRWDMVTQRFIVVGEDDAREVAEEFVRNSPTFVFDGISETLELVQATPLEGQNGWRVVVRFDSRQAGYGDRTGQVLAQVITPHEAVIEVMGGVVFSAVMDEQWDMLTQQPVAAS